MVMIVENRGEVVGHLTKATPDMWCIEGEFEPVASEAGSRFVTSALRLDPRVAAKDPKQGIRAHLRESSDDQGCVLIVISLAQGRLVGRRVFESSAVAYALAEVPE